MSTTKGLDIYILKFDCSSNNLNRQLLFYWNSSLQDKCSCLVADTETSKFDFGTHGK